MRKTKSFQAPIFTRYFSFTRWEIKKLQNVSAIKMEKLRPKEKKCLVQGRTASPQFLPEDICQFVMESLWRAFSFPELMDYWLMFRKMHKEVFYVPHHENFFYSFSVGTLRDFKQDNSSLCVEVPRVSGRQRPSPIIAARVKQEATGPNVFRTPQGNQSY